jgi:hypothetical protein
MSEHRYRLTVVGVVILLLSFFLNGKLGTDGVTQNGNCIDSSGFLQPDLLQELV